MAHNGGRSQVNLHGEANSNKEYAVINMLKFSQPWQAGTTDFPGILNEHGYPQSDPTERLLTTFFIPPRSQYAAHEFVVKFTGEGRIEIPFAFTASEGGSFVTGMNIEGVDARVKFTFDDDRSSVTLYIEAVNELNPISDLVFCRSDHESRHDLGEVFNPDFLTKMRAANFGKIRFMGWEPTNSSNLCKWAHRGQSDDVRWAGGKWYPGAWGGTVAGTDTYTASAATDTPVAWTHGEIWQGHFTNANTLTTSTIDIGSRGAKSLAKRDGSALTAGYITATTNITLYYDGFLDKVLVYAYALSSGVPLEVMAQLCNELGAHGQYQYPFLSEDDYVTRAARVWKQNLSLSLTAYHGYTNEDWNFVFAQTTHSRNLGQTELGLAAGSDEDIHSWYGKRFTDVMNLVATEYGSQTNYKRVIEVQAAGSGTNTNTYRFLGSSLGVTEPNRPIDKADVIEFATYWQGANFREFAASFANPLTDLLAAADDYDSGSDVEGALDYVDNDIRQGTKSDVLGDATLKAFQDTHYARWHSFAVTYDKDMSEYEGALALTTDQTNLESRLTTLGHDSAYAAKIIALGLAYKQTARAKQVTLDRYNYFVSQARGVFPSQLHLAGNNNAWNLISVGLYGTEYKMLDAVEEFNASTGLPEAQGGVIMGAPEVITEDSMAAVVASASGGGNPAKRLVGGRPADLERHALALREDQEFAIIVPAMIAAIEQRSA